MSLRTPLHLGTIQTTFEVTILTELFLEHLKGRFTGGRTENIFFTPNDCNRLSKYITFRRSTQPDNWIDKWMNTVCRKGEDTTKDEDNVEGVVVHVTRRT